MNRVALGKPLTASRVTARQADDTWLLKALDEVKADLNRQAESAIGRLAIRTGEAVKVAEDATCDSCGRVEGIEVGMTTRVPDHGRGQWTYVNGTIIVVVHRGDRTMCTECPA